MSMDRPPQNDTVYRWILVVMIIDIVVGVALIVWGEFVLEERSISLAGAGLAAIGCLMFLFFRRLGRRQS